MPKLPKITRESEILGMTDKTFILSKVLSSAGVKNQSRELDFKKKESELELKIASLQREKDRLVVEREKLLGEKKESLRTREVFREDMKLEMEQIKEKHHEAMTAFLVEREAIREEIQILEAFEQVEPNMIAQNEELKAQLEELKLQYEAALSAKDRELEELTNSLKNQMLNDIQTKKIELFSLKKNQFDEQVRLIILQNHHYSAELEYQSRQMEKIIQKNESLRSNLTKLKGEFEAHRQIEQELGKRANYSSFIISELQKQNKVLSDKINIENEKVKENLEHENMRESVMTQNTDSNSKMIKQSDEQGSAMEKEYNELSSKLKELSSEIKSMENDERKYSRFVEAVLAHCVSVEKCYETGKLQKGKVQEEMALEHESFEELSDEQKSMYFKLLKDYFSELSKMV